MLPLMKIVSPLGIQTWPEYFTDEVSQEDGFEAVVKLTGVPFPGEVRTETSA
jgi:hypothetical protein